MSALLGGSGVARRPEMYTSYAADMRLFNTPAKRNAVLALIVATAALPFLLTDDLLSLVGQALALAVGAIGLNLVTGYAGQVSLGHAFFVGLGAFTASIVSGDPASTEVLGYGLPMIVWLPAAGLVPAIVGALVSPLAIRLKGLYLAIVTLGLVFIGEHLFEQAEYLFGLPGQGRASVQASVFGISLVEDGANFTFEQKAFWFALVILVIFAVLARNLARSDVGRAFAAVRDRDIAAEVIGVNLTKQKVLAFAVSSFYAGISGAVLYTLLRAVVGSSFNLLLSVEFLAMILIGGASTISGSIAGALFIHSLGRVTRELSGTFDFIPATGSGGLITAAQLETLLFGALIVGFLIFEPRGLFGIWVRIRNYWKGWPFSY